MRVTAIKCNKCNSTIFSRSRHDYRRCECGDVAIDGGFDYVKLAWKEGDPAPKTFQLTVNASKETLYDDWSNHTDKYGLINKKRDEYKKKVLAIYPNAVCFNYADEKKEKHYAILVWNMKLNGGMLLSGGSTEEKAWAVSLERARLIQKEKGKKKNA